MFTIKKTPEFIKWFASLRDIKATVRLAKRLDKVQRGILGDVKPIGEGVSELRENFGAGWRMYYIQRGQTLIIMLGGGDKSTQERDIAAAKKLAATLED